ncbi:MAG: hypothetical protein DHS80DRAFT_31032 [Piptocephalis tieghemiana]|nr:MAG: hypothetical protein DHS80DRAFT_31032 [Piptocephalis tieghemiana]
MLTHPTQILVGLAVLVSLAQASPFLNTMCPSPGQFYCRGTERLLCNADSKTETTSISACLTGQVCQDNGNAFGAICVYATQGTAAPSTGGHSGLPININLGTVASVNDGTRAIPKEDIDEQEDQQSDNSSSSVPIYPAFS